MLVDRDIAVENTVAHLGVEHMLAVVAICRPEGQMKPPRNTGPGNNRLVRDYCALTGAFVDEMFEE